jgi:transcriptional regulator with XRE-family HTH domain
MGKRVRGGPDGDGGQAVGAAAPHAAGDRDRPPRRAARKRAPRGSAAHPTHNAARIEARTSEMIAQIGAKLRALRLAKGLTLHELSTRSGLSSSMLSLLERGKTGPSIGTLVVICSVLDAEMGDLVGPPRQSAPDPVSRFADCPVVSTADGVLRRILRSDTLRGVEIAVNEYKAGTASAPRPVAHEGYEFGIALEGELEITIDGAVHRLGEGDLVAYHSTEPHRIANPGQRRARALWVNLRKG